MFDAVDSAELRGCLCGDQSADLTVICCEGIPADPVDYHALDIGIGVFKQVIGYRHVASVIFDRVSDLLELRRGDCLDKAILIDLIKSAYGRLCLINAASFIGLYRFNRAERSQRSVSVLILIDLCLHILRDCVAAIRVCSLAQHVCSRKVPECICKFSNIGLTADRGCVLSNILKLCVFNVLHDVELSLEVDQLCLLGFSCVEVTCVDKLCNLCLHSIDLIEKFSQFLVHLISFQTPYLSRSLIMLSFLLRSSLAFASLFAFISIARSISACVSLIPNSLATICSGFVSMILSLPGLRTVSCA